MAYRPDLELVARQAVRDLGLPNHPSIKHVHHRALRMDSETVQPVAPYRLRHAVQEAARKLFAKYGREGHYDVGPVQEAGPFGHYLTTVLRMVPRG